MRNEREGAARIVPPPAEKESTGALAAPITADALVQNKVAKKQVSPEAPRLAGGFVAAPPPASPTRVPSPPSPSAATETVEVNGSAPAVETEGKTMDLPVSGAAGGAASDQKHIAAMNKAKSAPQVSAAPQQQAANINTNAMMLSQGVSRAMTQVATLSSAVIVTPDNKVWWKIGANGSVELTTDTGTNWKTLSTGVTAQLTSGSAPSSKICWIAGQAGTLVLTTDGGRHWTRVTTPISGDLGGVHAGDARHATIWDSANRLSYETSDGGATWKQVANE